MAEGGGVKYLSVCSGIEAATVAWHPLGWQPEAFSEIDKFPSAVLAHHYPNVPNWGDMTKFQEWPDAAIDVLVGGTPCQSFSIAGLRQGLADPRGELMLTYLAIAGRYRPHWLVWENVPGVLSNNGGRDFGTLLRGLAELGYGFAYRIFDAQYAGLAQQRKRVFVVGHLGDWRAPAAVLFERESLSGYPAPRREAGEAVAGTLSARTQGGGGLGTDFECNGGLIAMERGQGGAEINENDGCPTLACNHEAPIIAHTLRGEGFDASEDGTGRGTPLVPVAFDCKASGSYGFGAGEVAPTLRAMGHRNGHGNGGGQVAVAVSLRGRDGGATAEITEGAHPALRASQGGGDKPHVLVDMAVRRITPRETERLQGFPDDYTKIPYGKKPAGKCPDGPRYRALGNSMAVPVVRWIGERIAQVEQILKKQVAA